MHLEAAGISVRFGQITAVHDVSLSIEHGETICLTGPNGAGKSSTLQAIAGAVPIASGTVHLNGVDVTGTDPATMARKGISLVPEGRRIFSRLTVLENLLLGASTRSRKHFKQEVSNITNYFPALAERQQELAGNLSGGEQQMLAIGRALMSNPTLLMLDEPSLGLAPKLIDQVYDIVAGLQSQHLSILIVEESLHRALHFAQRTYILNSGRVILSGASDELRKNDSLENTYFGLAEL